MLTATPLFPLHRRVYGTADSRGFTLLELLAALAVGAICLSIAVPSYRGFVEKQKISLAVGQLSQIAMTIQKYRLQNSALPESLADMQLDGMRDPWGQAYRYLNFSSAIPGISGKIRRR